MKRITIRVSNELHKRMREIAEDAATTMSNWASMALRRSARNWDASVEPPRKRGDKREPAGAVWESGWLRSKPCYQCEKYGKKEFHDPLTHPIVTQHEVNVMMAPPYEAGE